MSVGPLTIAGVKINPGSLEVLAKLPLEIEAVHARSMAALVDKGLASEESMDLVITDAGRKVLAAWKANGNGAPPPTSSKPAAPAKSARQGQDRKSGRDKQGSSRGEARRGTGVPKGRGEPAAAVPSLPTAEQLRCLREQLVIEHAAELAAIDKSIEIVEALP